MFEPYLFGRWSPLGVVQAGPADIEQPGLGAQRQRSVGAVNQFQPFHPTQGRCLFFSTRSTGWLTCRFRHTIVPVLVGDEPILHWFDLPQ